MFVCVIFKVCVFWMVFLSWLFVLWEFVLFYDSEDEGVEIWRFCGELRNCLMGFGLVWEWFWFELVLLGSNVLSFLYLLFMGLIFFMISLDFIREIVGVCVFFFLRLLWEDEVVFCFLEVWLFVFLFIWLDWVEEIGVLFDGFVFVFFVFFGWRFSIWDIVVFFFM